MEPSPEDCYRPPPEWAPRELPGAWGRESLRAITATPWEDAERPRGRHALQLHSLGTPNGFKVSILLEELLESGCADAEYDAWLVNIKEGEQFSSGFLEINPNATIPALLDYQTAGESGSSPTRVFESNAILIYLAEKFKKFLPPVTGRAEVFSWVFWQAGAGPYFGFFNTYYTYWDQESAYLRDCVDRGTLEVKRSLSVLNVQLEKQESKSSTQTADERQVVFVCSIGEPTIADFAIFPWIRSLRRREKVATFLNFKSSEYAAIFRWCDRLESRPGVLRGLRVNAILDPNGIRERHSADDFKAS
ncbi:unnamed protein product [Amoebophrya sp. A25]|nr:unnamed protein product [Amoebophrya sp. A25]|eukprot:GSA25T00006774001.1